MSRQLIRILGKKRGSRQSVSSTFSIVGNLAFSLTLLLLGIVSGIQLVTNLTGDVADWLLGIVVLSFVIFGAQGLIADILRSRVGDELKYSFQQNVHRLDITQKGKGTRRLPNVPLVDTLLTSPGAVQRWRLAVTTGKPVEVISMIVFFSIWTIVSVFLLVYSVSLYFADANSGWSWWLPTLSLLPASGIAIWSGRMLHHELKNQINIDPLKVEISHQPIYPGETYDVAISQRGTLHVRSLRLFLVCEEITSYHQGTDIRTETLETYRQQVFVQRRFEITSKNPLAEVFTVTIPPDAMHSFQANFNCVQWKLVSVGRYREVLEIRRGFSLIVHPPYQDVSEDHDEV
ncbi:MAG: hypothetical protein VX738_03200 [Planctomycetota bacterium]|nr:hypothetical protein [Planctomycetota bacterium]